MTSLTVTATGRSTLLQAFPVSLKLDKPADVATVADVKAALAAKFPKVWSDSPYYIRLLDTFPSHPDGFYSCMLNVKSSHPRARPMRSMMTRFWPPQVSVMEAN